MGLDYRSRIVLGVACESDGETLVFAGTNISLDVDDEIGIDLGTDKLGRACLQRYGSGEIELGDVFGLLLAETEYDDAGFDCIEWGALPDIAEKVSQSLRVDLGYVGPLKLFSVLQLS